MISAQVFLADSKLKPKSLLTAALDFILQALKLGDMKAFSEISNGLKALELLFIVKFIFPFLSRTEGLDNAKEARLVSLSVL